METLRGVQSEFWIGVGSDCLGFGLFNKVKITTKQNPIYMARFNSESYDFWIFRFKSKQNIITIFDLNCIDSNFGFILLTIIRKKKNINI